MTAWIWHKARKPHGHTVLSLEEEKEEEEELELKGLERAVLSRNNPPHSTTYSLSSAASSSARSLSSQEPGDLDHEELRSSINPSDHFKTLLSQLLSSISSMKGAFAQLQATLRACNCPQGRGGGGRMVTSPAEKVMAEELQGLSRLHVRLYSVLQEQGAMAEEKLDGGIQGMSSRSDAESILKAYEGIISRFHDEIRKKEAVVEALKETLAKSMLKGEKLERRVKTLQAQLSLK